MKTVFAFLIACCAATPAAFAQDFAGALLTPDRDVANPQAAWWDDAWWDKGQLPQVQNHKVVERTVTYMNGDVEVPAVVLRPDDDKQYPAVLFQHGRAGWMDLIQRHARRLAARGFVVLAPDVYAARFIDPRPIPHDYVTETDVAAGLDYLLALPDVSTKRACFYSHTRGGYYTLKASVTHKRQDDAVGCYISYYPHLQDPNAPEADQVYRYAPEAQQLRVPALIFIGEYEQYQRKRAIESAVKAMQGQGTDATLITYPGVGRGFDFRPAGVRTIADDLASKDAVARAAKFIRAQLAAYAK